MAIMFLCVRHVMNIVLWNLELNALAPDFEKIIQKLFSTMKYILVTLGENIDYFC